MSNSKIRVSCLDCRTTWCDDIYDPAVQDMCSDGLRIGKQFEHSEFEFPSKEMNCVFFEFYDKYKFQRKISNLYIKIHNWLVKRLKINRKKMKVR